MSAPAWQRARHSSPSSFTSPTGRHGLTTVARWPIMVAAPAVTGRRRTLCHQNQISSVPSTRKEASAITSHSAGRIRKSTIATIRNTSSPARLPFGALLGALLPTRLLHLGRPSLRVDVRAAHELLTAGPAEDEDDEPRREDDVPG